MLSACRVIGKIRVRSAAGGGPFAVKRGAVNASSSLKPPCIIRVVKSPGRSGDFDLYSCCGWLESRPGHRVFRFEVFHGLPLFLQAKAG
jgi:hypothetical protein